MFRRFDGRCGHYLLLLLVGGMLFFPNLGRHGLWDEDEANNAECAREMWEAAEWRIPTFNYELRTDKPALLYWLMMAAYQWFGVGEFAARFWSAVCGLGSVLVTYELGRLLFGKTTGLLAGVVLASAILFCLLAHAATPESLLIFLSLATLLLFWKGYMRQSGAWLLGAGITTGLGVLAKGPVGWLLPMATIGLFLLWQRQLPRLFNRFFPLGGLLFLAIALPWYVLVGLDTQWAFLKGFFFEHNVRRYLQPMENHSGPVLFYHPLALLVCFAPWSAFLGLALWYGTGRRASQDLPNQQLEESNPAPLPSLPAGYRFLWCWIGVWLVFYSLSGTKLPHYVLPAYPALALLTARFLVRWASGSIQPAPALIGVCLGCLGVVGLVIGGGFSLISGTVAAPGLAGKELPALAALAWLGLLPIAAVIPAWIWMRQRRRTVIGLVALSSVALVGLLAGLGPRAVHPYHLSPHLAGRLEAHQQSREVQIGCYRFFQPSLVFYTRRQIERLGDDQAAVDLLHRPVESYLVVPAQTWEELRPRVETSCTVVARHREFQTGREILLITNW
jgi:4-amino-4-deoxy-L-arabinose transferase-like glycosyltransferase